MKRTITILAAILLTIVFQQRVCAQIPEKMSYQAVLRDNNDNLITNTEIGMQISILQGSENGPAIYIETQTPTSNANGLVSLEIGDGTEVLYEFSTIDWSSGPFFIKIETDPSGNGGTNYTITGTSQLLSVPYALHAKTVEIDKVDDADANPNNELQTLSVSGNQLSISDGNSVTLPFNIDSIDIDPTNEIQDISLNGLELTISKGSIVNLSTVRDGTGTDNQKLYLSDNGELEISKGNTITLPFLTNEQDGDPGNEIQVLSISNDTIFLSAGGFVKLPVEADPLFTAWDKSSGISITTSQISDLNPEVFEKELTDNENNINVGFEIQPTSLVFYNGNVLPAGAWAGVSTQILNLNITTNLYDNLKVKK